MKRLTSWLRTQELSRKLCRDRRGAVIIYVTMIMVVLLGGAALVIDGGRILNLQTELQGAADAAALAAAAELDRKSDSITRANLALANLVQNDQRFADGADAVGIAQVRFLSGLPADDEDAYSDATVTTDPLQVRYVDVMVDSRTINGSFIQFLTGQSTAQANARAVAGFDQAVCQFTPLFICNPYEVGAVNQGPGSYADIYAAVADASFRRRQIKLAQLGGNDQPAPGNFGFLEDPNQSGGAALRDALATVSPQVCFIQNGVNTKTGATTGPVRQGMNTRFDIYDGSFNSQRDNAAYRPAVNVTKGYTFTGNACNATAAPDTDAMGLPRDNCYSTDTCNAMGPSDGRMGNGNWDFDAYWDINHGTGTPPNTWSNANLPSRYEVYRYEVETPAIPQPGVAPMTLEDGDPGCYNAAAAGVAPSDAPDRRVIYAAVINCEADLSPGSNDDVPVEAFIKLFLTEPVGSTDDDPANTKDAIYAEILGLLEPGVGTIEEQELLRDIVQLYR